MWGKFKRNVRAISVAGLVVILIMSVILLVGVFLTRQKIVSKPQAVGEQMTWYFALGDMVMPPEATENLAQEGFGC